MKNTLLVLFSTFSFCALLSQGTWMQKANCPLPGHYSCPGFSLSGKGYITTGNAPNNFAEYDPANNSWQLKADFPDSAEGFAFTIGNKGYIGEFYSSNEFWEYDPVTDSWVQKANFPGPLRRIDVRFAIGTKGYVATGISPTAYHNDVWEWDQLTNTWEQKANFSGSERVAAVGFSIGDKGFIATGLSLTDYCRDLWQYNQATDTWTQKANFGGTKRSEATAFVIGSCAYVGTGTTSVGTGSVSDFWKYDVWANTWTPVSNFAGNLRELATAFSIDCKGYVGMGWINDYVSSYQNDLWEYTPDTCDLSGINENNSGLSATFFPSPFSFETTLSTNTALKNATLLFYTTNGQLVKQLPDISGKTMLIKKENLPAGVYIVKIMQDNKIIYTGKCAVVD